MRYYWCVNCGYHGDFGIYRARNIKCECCEYDALTEYDEKEWVKEGMDKKHELDKNDKYYEDKKNGKNKRTSNDTR